MNKNGSTVLISHGHGGESIAPPLLKFTSHLDCVLGTNDSGGSTGILRKDRNHDDPSRKHCAYGDSIRVMESLLPRGTEAEKIRARLFGARFNDRKYSKYNGHKIRNWDLGWLVEQWQGQGCIEDAFPLALEELCKAANIPANCRFLPMSVQSANICAVPRLTKLETDHPRETIFRREHLLDNRRKNAHPITDAFLHPRPHIHSWTQKAILDAQKIAISSGSWWPTIALTDTIGYPETLQASSAFKILIMNLIAKENDTAWDDAKSFVELLRVKLGISSFDAVLCNDPRSLPKHVLTAYAKEFAKPVRVSKRIPGAKRVIIGNFASWREDGRVFHNERTAEVIARL